MSKKAKRSWNSKMVADIWNAVSPRSIEDADSAMRQFICENSTSISESRKLLSFAEFLVANA